ncbi:hypothetical protein AA0535_2297 [Asaia krungthepensis NRIC 0535]|uniref:Uncharacterized protein n=1 Tax=Asaia krungthepensis NRIC 0535 TaxID=1307925 RepID=A0ABQ0Q4S8_9PROT|nr:hypothetical protein AA0535_2297 [Asaia krungthepensis NRIC 0535]
MENGKQVVGKGHRTKTLENAPKHKGEATLEPHVCREGERTTHYTHQSVEKKAVELPLTGTSEC